MERVRVIKFDTEKHDTIIQRHNGERLLLQHNRLCDSMNVDFPVYLIWKSNEVDKLKVASNEICEVYNWGGYSDDVVINKRIKNPNFLLDDHLAEIEWNNKVYEIDYGEGCENLRNFEGSVAYINNSGATLADATLYLPGNRGQCTINSTDFIEQIEVPEEIDSPIKNLYYKAENNEVIFYWDEPDDDQSWLYLISRSKYQINPDDYHWRQMPYLRFAHTNTYKATQLANGTKYYFYLAAKDDEGNLTQWQEYEITPIKTAVEFHNDPDPEQFEIEIIGETDEYFTLSWPDKSEESRRYLIQLFLNSKRKVLDIIDGTVNEWNVEKEYGYIGAGFRFEVRSLPKDRFGQRYSDGIYWEWEAE
jgi:hypothetical protein